MGILERDMDHRIVWPVLLTPGVVDAFEQVTAGVVDTTFRCENLREISKKFQKMANNEIIYGPGEASS